MSNNIVHISHPAGHRKAYQDLLVTLTNFTPLTTSVSNKSITTLIRAQKMLFATVGSNFRRYFMVCCIRAILGRSSCALFLGAMAMRKNANPLPSYFDRLLSKVWTRLPKQKTLAILPYSLEPSLAEVTNDFIYDPQMWDMWLNDQPISAPSTALSASIQKESNGRKILIYIGKGAKYKSFPKLVQFAKANQDKLFVVAAGTIMKECSMEAEVLRSLGMKVEDRFITDEELLSLYSIADYAWCYYAPEYDQASGIYGRAVQLGVVPILRHDSIIEKLSQELRIPYLSLHTKDFRHDLTPALTQVNFSEQPLKLEERQALFSRLRDESLRKVTAALK